MDERKNKFSLASSAVATLDLAQQISFRFKCSTTTDVSILVAIIVLQISPLHQKLTAGGMADDEINFLALELMRKYAMQCTLQKEVILLKLEPTSYSLSDKVYSLLQMAKDFAETSYSKSIIGINELFAVCTNIDAYESFLDICTVELEKTSAKPLEKRVINIPVDLSGCLTILNDEFDENDTFCKILGRDEETLNLVRVLAKDTKRNAVLIGEPGVGKTAIVEKLTWLIVTHNCPAKFQDSIIVSLDINSIIAGTIYRGSAEARFNSLIKFLEDNKNCILFIDEIHNLLGAGACRDGDLDLANALKPILARGTTRVIGATTLDEYNKYFSKDGALKRRFEKVVVKEPKSSEVYPMIKNQIERLSTSHNVTISKEIIDMIIFYASCFSYETKNPDRTLDLVDRAMTVAELNCEKSVTRNDILANFNLNYKIFEKTPLKHKLALAHHEAGHYIVHRFSPELFNYNILAVSIMPADDYYGVNVFDIDTDIIPSRTRDYHIQLIASKLGGRVAEKMYSNQLSAGASGDLATATKIAKDMITRYGLDENFTQNRVYLRESDNPMYNDSVIDKINIEIDSIVEEARKYAESILNSHSAELTILVDALSEKGMLSATEIDELFVDTQKIIPAIPTQSIDCSES